MTEAEELQRREAALAHATLTIVQAIAPLGPMIAELRTHVVNAKWMPLFALVEVLLLSCILVALLAR
jgi:hypothetical protein